MTTCMACREVTRSVVVLEMTISTVALAMIISMAMRVTTCWMEVQETTRTLSRGGEIRLFLDLTPVMITSRIGIPTDPILKKLFSKVMSNLMTY